LSVTIYKNTEENIKYKSFTKYIYDLSIQFFLDGMSATKVKKTRPVSIKNQSKKKLLIVKDDKW